MSANSPFEAVASRFRDLALSYPGTHEDQPWGHSAFKVGKKGFLFLHADGETFSMSTKLPETSGLALTFPFAQPTGYGLGRAGWVTAAFAPGDAIPEALLVQWVKESYLAIAPKKLAALIGGAPAGKVSDTAAQAKRGGAKASGRTTGGKVEAARKSGAPSESDSNKKAGGAKADSRTHVAKKSEGGATGAKAKAGASAKTTAKATPGAGAAIDSKGKGSSAKTESKTGSAKKVDGASAKVGATSKSASNSASSKSASKSPSKTRSSSDGGASTKAAAKSRVGKKVGTRKA